MVDGALYRRSLGHLASDKKRRGRDLVLSRFEALGKARVELVPAADVTRALGEVAPV
jgi:hypothetical protein